jgi:hypothetical protein
MPEPPGAPASVTWLAASVSERLESSTVNTRRLRPTLGSVDVDEGLN